MQYFCNSIQSIHLTLIMQPHYRIKQLLYENYNFHYSARIEIKQNVEIWHFRLSQLANSSKPCKNSLFEDVFKVSAPSFHTSSKSFDKAQYGLVGGVLCILFARISSARIWLGLKCLVAFKHSSPYTVIKRIKVWWVRWPFVIIIRVLPKKFLCEKL